MTRLALDLATTTGWAIQDDEGIRWGEWELPNRFEGERLTAFATFLADAGSGVDEFILEAPAHFRSIPAARVAFGLRAVAVLCAANWHIPVRDVAPNTLKKFCTGNGRAGKEQMREAAIRWLGEQGHSLRLSNDFGYDAADAVCLLMWAEGKDQ